MQDWVLLIYNISDGREECDWWDELSVPCVWRRNFRGLLRGGLGWEGGHESMTLVEHSMIFVCLFWFGFLSFVSSFIHKVWIFWGLVVSKEYYQQPSRGKYNWDINK